MSQYQATAKEYSNYYNRALTKNKPEIKNTAKQKEQQSRQLSYNQTNQIKTKDFNMKDIAANQNANQIADQDDVNPSPYQAASQDDIFLKKSSLINNQLNKKKDSLNSSNNMKLRNHQHYLKPSSNSLNFDTKSASSQQPLLKFGGLKSSIQVQANQGQNYDFLEQTDTMRSSIHNNLSNDASPKLANTQKLSSNLKNLKITDNAQQIYMKTQQKKQDDMQKFSVKKLSSYQQAFQKQKQQTAVIQIPQINQDMKNQISRTVCSVQSTQSPIRKFQQFQEKQDKTLKKFGSVDCGQMIDYLHSQSVLQKPSNQTLLNAHLQNYEIANKSNQNEAIKRLEYSKPLQSSQNKYIPTLQNSNSSLQLKLQQSYLQNDNQKRQIENTLQEIRSPLSVLSKRVPGSCLAGGAAIQKLSKLEAKDQDEVNDVTEDESEDNQKTNNKVYSQDNQPSISINNLLSLQSAPVTNLQTQFNSPNQDFRNYVENLQIKSVQNNILSNDNKNQQSINNDVDSNLIDNENQKLRDEFIKVKQELELLKKKQKFRNNVSGMSLPVTDRCAITQLKSPKNGPFDEEIIQRTGKQGQVVLTFGNKNVNNTEQQHQEQKYTYREEITQKNKNNQSQTYEYMKNQISYNNIKMSDASIINQNIYQSIDQLQESIDSIEPQKLKNKIGSVTQRYERQSNLSQKLQSSDEKVKIYDNNFEEKQNQQYQSIQTKKPPSHYVKTLVQDKSMRSKENIESDIRNIEINKNNIKQNIRNQNQHVLKPKKEKQSSTIDYNNNKNLKQISRTNSYNEVEVVDMTDEIASSHYKIMQLKQENDMLRTVSSRLQKNIRQNQDKQNQKVEKTSQNQKLQNSQKKQINQKHGYPSHQQSLQEFKGSFQNKIIVHKNEKKESISIYGATVGDHNSSRRQFLNTCKKSFGSDGSKLSNNEREQEYSASASNNSMNESNSSHSQQNSQHLHDDKQFNYKINSQYSQLASIRTKNRKRSVKNQNASRTVVSSAVLKSNGPYQKIVDSSRNYNEEIEQNHLLNSIDRINSKSKPIAHIDLLAQNTIKKKDIRQRNSSISCKNQSDMTSQDEQSDKKEHSFHKQNKNTQDAKQKVQQNIISDCQKQITELQNQLKSLQLGQMPIMMAQNNLSQQSMNSQLLITPRDQQQMLLQQQLQAYQLYQHNMMNPVSSPHTLQFSQTSGAALTPFTPLSSQNMINQTSQFLQHQQPFLSNQNPLNGVMQYGQSSAFEQYELQIQHLQNQIKEQQLQLQIQDQQNQVFQRNTINSPNDLFQQQQIQNFNDFQQNQFSQHQSEYNRNQAIFNNQEKSIQSRPGSVAKQNISLNTLSAFQVHQSGLQRVSQSIKMTPIQIQSGIQYNDTQNQSNFFTQNTEIGKNIDDEHLCQKIDFEKQNQYEADCLTDNRSRNDYKNLHKTQEFVQQKKENQYSDFEMVDIDDQENSLTKKVKQNNNGNSFDQYMQDDYGKYEDEELRAGLKMEQNQKIQKGTFAPSPDLLDQLTNFENNEMKKNQNFQTLKARDFDEKQQKNDSSEQISPDFKFSLYTENNKNKTNTKQLVMEKEHQQNKKDTLLVIGFDEQPRGVNPLNKKRQTQFKQQDKNKKGPEEYITVRDIDRISKVQRQSILKSSIPFKDQKDNEQIIEQYINDIPQKISIEKKNKGDLIIIQDDVPNLQEFAKQRRGKLGEHFQRQANNKCISPQPRRSDVLKDADKQILPPKSIKRFDKQDEDFQEPKKREDKSQQPKTKEELAEIRKKWMRTKFKDREDPRNPLSNIKSQNEENKTNQHIEINNFAKQREISTSQQLQESKNMDLMLRLASGQKAKVDVQAMKKLTHKNYEKLPEIIKKKAEQKKQQELEDRKNKYASYQKELKERLRNDMIKKRSQIQPNQPKQSQGETQ